MQSKIKSLQAREILDSRGERTVEVKLTTDLGSFFSSAPSGTSKGKYEALELRDEKGRGVSMAVKNVNEIINPELQGKDVGDQKEIDKILIELDGTKNKSKLGANALLPVSIAVCRAGAKAGNLSLYEHIQNIFQQNSNLPNTTYQLPVPSFLLIEGGLHADNELAIQEFMILPQESSFSENFQMGKKIYHTLGSILEKKYGKPTIHIGLEGGFTVSSLKETKGVLNFISQATKEAGYEGKVKIGVDAAASSFFKDNVYQFEGKSFSKEDLLNFYQGLFQKYPIFSIEDPFAEDDWEGFQMINEKFGKEVLIIGDDLLVTNLERITQAKEKKACNAMILKPNQIGTITEAIKAARLARSFDWKIMVSHRAGETKDDFIADLAVGISADFIKAGAPAREERMAKYNRLLRIEEEMK